MNPRPTPKQKHLIAAHFNVRELRGLDALQGHVERNPRTQRKSYRGLENKLRDADALKRVEGHLFEYTRQHGRMRRVDPKNGRKGDTTIAYIGPRLRRLLDMAAGRITRNPHDDHPEYFDLTGTLSSLGGGLAGSIGNIGNMVSGLGSTVGNLASGLGSGVANMVTSLPTTLSGVGNSIVDSVDNIGNDIFGGGTVSPQKFVGNLLNAIGPTWKPPSSAASIMLNDMFGLSTDQLHQAWTDLHPPTPMLPTHANNFIGAGLGGIPLPSLTPQAVDPFTGKPVNPPSSSSASSTSAPSPSSVPTPQVPRQSPAVNYGYTVAQSPYEYSPYQSYPSYSTYAAPPSPYNLAPSYSPYAQFNSYGMPSYEPEEEEEQYYSSYPYNPY